jgi:hypothetical protein
MKVECNHCQAKLNLPDDKLTPGSEFAFQCPKCKQKNIIQVPEPESVSSSVPSANDPVDDNDAVMPDFFEEGSKPALICFNPGNDGDELAVILGGLGYVPVRASSARDALNRMKLTQYFFIALEENYDGQSLSRNVVLTALQHMDMTTRRRIFVALFGDDFKSMDNMTAFALSVNTVVSQRDRNQWAKILKRAVAEYERFYKVYFDVMREMGKL